MTNEERDIIDKESEKIIKICTQFICELKLEYQNKPISKQQRLHVDGVCALLAEYLKAVYNIYNDQRNYRIRRDLETYKFLKLDSQKRQDYNESLKIEYHEDMNLEDAITISNVAESESRLNYEGSKSEVEKINCSIKQRKSHDSDITASNQSIEDDALSSRQHHNEMSAEDLQMLEIENKQLLSEFKGLSEEVHQIEKHVYDIAKLQELFTEKVSFKKMKM